MWVAVTVDAARIHDQAGVLQDQRVIKGIVVGGDQHGIELRQVTGVLVK